MSEQQDPNNLQNNLWTGIYFFTISSQLIMTKLDNLMDFSKPQITIDESTVEDILASDEFSALIVEESFVRGADYCLLTQANDRIVCLLTPIFEICILHFFFLFIHFDSRRSAITNIDTCLNHHIFLSIPIQSHICFNLNQ